MIAHGLSRAAGWLCSRPIPRGLRAPAHRAFAALCGADLSEVEQPLDAYASVNAFFTRNLRASARPIVGDADALLCPCDGTAGTSANIADDTLVQAKSHTYSLAALVADAPWSSELRGGSYATLYLAPRNYHRFHSPISGGIASCTYVPGDLWPVNPAAVARVDHLFARNERLIIELRSAGDALLVVVAVGATLVGMARVAFDDVHTHARSRVIDRRSYAPRKAIARGEALGHFEFGSTLVVLASPAIGTLALSVAGSAVRVGQRCGTLTRDSARDAWARPA